MAKKKNTSKAKAKIEVDELTQTENFFDRNKKTILLLGGGVLAILIGYMGYQEFVAKPKDIESQGELMNAFYEFEKDSLTRAAEGTEQFTGLESIADEYKGTSGGDIANYSMGIISMKKGEFDIALDYFDDCDFSDVMVANLCIGLQADCYVELEDYSKAVKLFEKAANREVNEFTTPMFLKKAGLVLEELGEKSKANKHYNRIKDEFSTSETASDIDKYIGRTNS